MEGESDAQPYIPALIQDLIDKGLAYESQGALVVDIAEETDSKELPPCIVRSLTARLSMPPPILRLSCRGSRISTRIAIFTWWTSARSFTYPGIPRGEEGRNCEG